MAKNMNDALAAEIARRTADTYENGVENATRMIATEQMVFAHPNHTTTWQSHLDRLAVQLARFEERVKRTNSACDRGNIDTLRAFLNAEHAK